MAGFDTILEARFDAWPLDRCAVVEHEAGQAKLPNARLTVDRFHVMENLNDAARKARRAIRKQTNDAIQAVSGFKVRHA